MILACAFILSTLLAVNIFAKEDEFQYWPNGKVREGKRYNREGYLSEKVDCRTNGTIECRQWFDSLGHKIAEVNYDSQGRLDDNIRGWAAMKWLYKDGVARVRVAYGEDGLLKERKIYTEGGNLVNTQYFDDNSPGDERDRFDPNRAGYAQAEYYDQGGNLIAAAAADN